ARGADAHRRRHVAHDDRCRAGDAVAVLVGHGQADAVVAAGRRGEGRRGTREREGAVVGPRDGPGVGEGIEVPGCVTGLALRATGLPALPVNGTVKEVIVGVLLALTQKNSTDDSMLTRMARRSRPEFTLLAISAGLPIRPSRVE